MRKRMLIFMLALMLSLGLIACSDTSKADSSENNTDSTVVEEEDGFVYVEEESLTPYLDMLGVDITNGNPDVSQEFIDNLSSVEVLNHTGTIEHEYVTHEDGTTVINIMNWVSNETITEDEFASFVISLDGYFGQYGARLNDVYKADKTYLWVDYTRASSVFAWYVEGKAYLSWEWDENIEGSMGQHPMDKYANIPSEFAEDGLKRMLTFFDLTYTETGFDRNASSNTMGTRYPVGKVEFLGANCTVQIWYSEKQIQNGTGKATDVEIFLADRELSEVKKEISSIIGSDFISETDTSFKIKIPESNLQLSVYDDGITMMEIYITEIKEEEQEPEPVTESTGTTGTTKECEVDGCNSEGTYDIVGISGLTEYYCYTHYKEIEDTMQGMIDDVSDVMCEVDGCGNKGYYDIVGFSGMTEYYCYEHYKEMEDILNMMLEDVNN